MSHELRTPLTAILGYSSILSDGLFGELNKRQKDALEAVCKSSQHLKNLIDDVLNLARIESGKEEPEPTQVVIGELFSHVYKLLQQTATSKEIRILPPEVSEELAKRAVFSDPKHLQQVLINLLSNAIKYTKEGGKVWLSCESKGDKIYIAVHDTGVGISPEKAKVIFDRFERGDDEYSRQQEGTGIGLNLTRRLVEINGGKIGFSSELGKGSTFWFLMPTISDDESRAKLINTQEEATTKISLEGLSVVVVDDNQQTREMLQLILEGAGANTFVCQTGQETLELLDKTHPDILITDLAMPQMDGIQLIKLIRERKENKFPLPIIVLSACAFDEDKELALASGATFFLAKPFRPSEILISVRNITLSAAMRQRRL
jgi:CheY-like chemotaxis protein/anti-sigma regulatory factor (Ser/Thr protein kinase)